MRTHFHIEPFGEYGLLVILGDKIDFEVNRRVHHLSEWLRLSNIHGIRELIPAYASLLIEFDPFQVDLDTLYNMIFEGLDRIQMAFYRRGKMIEIPTIYGGDYGPDLDFVAEYNRLTPAEVIRLHSEGEYTVFMMGFSPGFPYLGGMNPRIATPRLSSPRTRVPAGSVGIAGNQTGIYPNESAGGWQLIGWTPVQLFNPEEAPYFLLKPGDRLRFIPVGNDIISHD
ncbi:sensor histidine kinase inhibitor, KipI family [Bellilinea caldifistulae]|uniref:Carboxyltransferase domain-containing protein n=1 Tax=Bellilinea caldifistulae TaxID=360411 RepID=A0A0P6XNG2_9CHLR|nr:5-oxoprolinase subunit PxpB [Bellilinea caldifistulae]KPL78068.1 hypothetical protein AC812_02245 [Bellilinea caldifistulae]GAP10748.1 sensor histidine kinase inhibitor, KipI family [Bellilinea caldifistulae]